jgi:CBS domain-containing protein
VPSLQKENSVKTIRIKDLMISLSDYATVREDATLAQVIAELERVQSRFEIGRYPHRAVLVLNDQGDVVGKVGQIDILRALEPKYDQIAHPSARFYSGFSHQFMRSLLKTYQLLQKSMEDICRKAYQRRVNTFMVTPTEGEFVDENATLDEAIHQLVMGHHQSALVLRHKEIVGILRLTDVFEAISNMIKKCRLSDVRS